MAIPFLSNINLNGNQALNLALHNKTTPPSNPSSGQSYFDTADTDNGRVLVYNGSQWVSIAGDIESVGTTTSNQLTVTNQNGPDVSLAIVTGAVANGGTALATGDQIYDFVTGLGYVESVASGDTDTITIGGTAVDPTISANTAAVADGSTNLATGDQIYDFVIGQNYSTTTGTVTSVAISGTDGIDVDSGSPITSSGTITLGLSNVPNSSLANNSITIGDSTIALGGTDTTLTGLTDIDLTAGNKTIFDGVGANNLTIGASGTTVVIPGDLQVTGTTTTNNVETVSTSNGVVFEGNAADENELTLLAGSVTADRTVTLPDATGTVALTDDLHDEVTLDGAYDYITISGQTITRNQIDYNTDIANKPTIPTVNNATITLAAGNSGITMDTDNQFTTNQSGNEEITISHADTSSQASVNNSNQTVIQDVTLDTYGHVTGLTSVDLSSAFDTTGKITKKIVGDASTTAFTVTHSFGTPHVSVMILDYGDNGTGATYEQVYADVQRSSDDAVTVTFASAPSATQDYLALITKFPAIS